MKLENVSPSRLVVAKYNPKIRTEKGKMNKLFGSIKKNGIVIPLLVDGSMNVIDGHRRLACAKNLKLKTVPVIISKSSTKKDELYETINTSSRKLSASELIFVSVNGGTVSPSAQKQISRLKEIVGYTELKKLGEKYVSISILNMGEKIGRHCMDKSNTFVKKSIMWVIKYRQTYRVRRAMEDGISKEKLKNIILNNKPLHYDWK